MSGPGGDRRGAGTWSILRKATTGAGIAFVVGLVPALAVSLSVYLASDPRTTVPQAMRVGGLLFLWFHRVEVSLQARFVLGPESGAPEPGMRPGVPLTVTLVVAALAGTFLVVYLLVRAGRGAGRSVEGPGWARGMAGAAVALSYAALCLGLAAVLRFRSAVPANPVLFGPLEVRPSFLAALLWPLGIAAVAGFAGGFFSDATHRWPDRAWTPFVRGGLSGGLGMLLAGLALSLGGLLVFAATEPSVTGKFLGAIFEPGALRGITVLALLVLIAPTLAVWALIASLGGCVGVSGSATACLFSYGRFPAGSRAVPDGLFGPFSRLEGAPPELFLFLLVPLLTVLIGGSMAARRSEARTRTEGTIAGAVAGVAFSVLTLAAAVLSTMALEIGGGEAIGIEQVTYRLGPDIPTGLLLALAWGVIGGALGGAGSVSLSSRRAAGQAEAG